MGATLCSCGEDDVLSVTHIIIIDNDSQSTAESDMSVARREMMGLAAARRRNPTVIREKNRRADAPPPATEARQVDSVSPGMYSFGEEFALVSPAARGQNQNSTLSGNAEVYTLVSSNTVDSKVCASEEGDLDSFVEMYGLEDLEEGRRSAQSPQIRPAGHVYVSTDPVVPLAASFIRPKPARNTQPQVAVGVGPPPAVHVVRDESERTHGHKHRAHTTGDAPGAAPPRNMQATSLRAPQYISPEPPQTQPDAVNSAATDSVVPAAQSEESGRADVSRLHAFQEHSHSGRRQRHRNSTTPHTSAEAQEMKRQSEHSGLREVPGLASARGIIDKSTTPSARHIRAAIEQPPPPLEPVPTSAPHSPVTVAPSITVSVRAAPRQTRATAPTVERSEATDLHTSPRSHLPQPAPLFLRDLRRSPSPVVDAETAPAPVKGSMSVSQHILATQKRSGEPVKSIMQSSLRITSRKSSAPTTPHKSASWTARGRPHEAQEGVPENAGADEATSVKTAVATRQEPAAAAAPVAEKTFTEPAISSSLDIKKAPRKSSKVLGKPASGPAIPRPVSEQALDDQVSIPIVREERAVGRSRWKEASPVATYESLSAPPLLPAAVVTASASPAKGHGFTESPGQGSNTDFYENSLDGAHPPAPLSRTQPAIQETSVPTSVPAQRRLSNSAVAPPKTILRPSSLGSDEKPMTAVVLIPAAARRPDRGNAALGPQGPAW